MTKYYLQKILESSLEKGFNEIDNEETNETGFNINFSEFKNYFNEIKNEEKNSEHDFMFSKLIFHAIEDSNLDKKFTHDLRFWQWICINEIREYIFWRWNINEDSPSKYPRFLGAGGVTGFSKNSASRLYFPAASLLNKDDGEDLLKEFWKFTQKELSISQSTLSINPKIFYAIAKATKNLNGDETKAFIIQLNFLKSNLFLDLMDENEISNLVTSGNA